MPDNAQQYSNDHTQSAVKLLIQSVVIPFKCHLGKL